MILNYSQASSIHSRLVSFFVRALAMSLAAIVSAYFLFPSQAGIVSVFLVSFSLLTVFDFILEKNKTDIWEVKTSPVKANAEMAAYLGVLFLGIFTVYFCASLFLAEQTVLSLFYKQLEDAPTKVSELNFGTFWPIFSHNLAVLFIFFFFSLLYRTGTLFVLGWNASVWGAVFGVIAKNMWGESFVFSNYIKMLIAIMPHLLMEAIAYILISMSGVFLSKAITKYKILSDPFNQVMRASLIILMSAMGCLILAAGLETQLASFLIDKFF